MTRSLIRTTGAEGLTLSSTSLTVANGLTLTDGDVTVASGHGVSFAATSDATGMASELLDDYEEGVFTATMNNSVTLDSTYNKLEYTKIGRLVVVGGQIQINNDNSNSHVEINNLPFTCIAGTGDSERMFCSVRVYNHEMANDAQYVGAFTTQNTTELNFCNVKDNAATSDLSADQNGYIMFTLTYMAA